MKKLFLPFLVVALFVSEGIFADLWLKSGEYKEYVFVPRFVLITIVFISIYVTRFHGVMYGFIFGVLYDIVYTEVLGVYTFAFALVAYITSKAIKIFHNNTFVASFLSLVMITILEFYVYGIYIIIGEINMSLDTFAYKRLVPTLLLNISFNIVFSYPLKKRLTKIAGLGREM